MKPKIKKLSDYAKRGVLPRNLVSLIQKYGYFLEKPNMSKKEFYEAFHSKRTSNTVRWLLIISTFLRDRHLTAKRLRHKPFMNVGISLKMNRKKKATHHEIKGVRTTGKHTKKGKAQIDVTESNPIEKVPLTPKDTFSIMNARMSKTETSIVEAILRDFDKSAKALEYRLRLVEWVIETFNHLTNLQWLLVTALKLFDRFHTIIYSQAAKDVEDDNRGPIEGSDEMEEINLHGYPQHALHYEEQDKHYELVYQIMAVLTEDQNMIVDLRRSRILAEELETKTTKSLNKAWKMVIPLCVEIARTIRSVSILDRSLLMSMKKIGHRARRKELMDKLMELEVYEQSFHTMHQTRGGRDKWTTLKGLVMDFDKKTAENVLKGLEGFEQREAKKVAKLSKKLSATKK